MAVGVLLLTHEGIGTSLLRVARRLLGAPPALALDAFEADWYGGVDEQLAGASAAMRRVDGGDGVLLLVDVYGATPSRIAARLAQLGTPARRVTGVGLPMLLRVLNYPEQTLDELARTAAAGGRNGVVVDDA